MNPQVSAEKSATFLQPATHVSIDEKCKPCALGVPLLVMYYTACQNSPVTREPRNYSPAKSV